MTQGPPKAQETLRATTHPLLRVRRRIATITERLAAFVVLPFMAISNAVEFVRVGWDPFLAAYLATAILWGILSLLANRWSLRTRGILLTSFAFTLAAIGIFYFGPRIGNGAALMVVAFFAALFQGRALLYSMMGGALGVMTIGAALGRAGLEPLGWVRLSFTMLVSMFVLGEMVRYVLASMGRAHDRMEEALQREIEERRVREAAQRELMNAQRLEALGQLAGGIAHDINNSLSVIMSNAVLLQNVTDLEPDDREILEDIVAASDSAQDVVSRLMALGRADNTGPDIDRCDAAEVLKRIERSLTRLFPESISISVTSDCTPTIPWSEGTFERVLLNLAFNARDAMPRGGSLEFVLTHDRDAEQVHLFVQDTGTGIAPEDRDRIFEPFFTTKARGEGSGMGLASVYAYITRHGGQIEVDSEVGEGTRFTITLPSVMPLADDDPSLRQRERDEAPMRILLAEDDERVRRTLAKVLDDLGHHVTTACDGPEALVEMGRGGDAAFDLLFTDAVMPETNTHELIETFLGRYHDAEVIICSGWLGEEAIETDFTDAIHFLPKPFVPRQVQGVLDGLRRRA